jgi:hypothetical protein
VGEGQASEDQGPEVALSFPSHLIDQSKYKPAGSKDEKEMVPLFVQSPCEGHRYREE